MAGPALPAAGPGSRRRPGGPPRALVHRHRVLQANPAARAAGVETGLRLATARALCEALEVREADDGARDRALRHQGRQLLALTLRCARRRRPACCWRWAAA
ncbi:hypothetical protein HML84_03845 [Alcanivorax sp. IO_7]|nr:hypothetical protein HML84_03845 [Alcanivorax sp. IO_7]